MPADPPLDFLIASWWEYQRRSVGTRAERTALEMGEPTDACNAHAVVDEAVQRGDRTVLDVLAAINESGPPGDDGRAVGCGPLEDLLNQHGATLGHDAAVLARRSPAFARALAHVQLST